MKQELLIGAGFFHDKQIKLHDDPAEFENLITLDINPDRKPDVVWDLNDMPLPFEHEIFDEIHAYHVLEHLGSQGDAKAFFGFFEEMWRLLKIGGRFHATVPYWKGEWVFGDPGHTRMIHPNSIQFLSQDFYKNKENTMTSDYRYIYKANFSVASAIYNDDPHNGVFGFILKKEPIC